MTDQAMNTDRELWRERAGDYYADSIHVTQSGAIGINCGGTVIVMPIRKWHDATREIAHRDSEIKRLERERVVVVNDFPNEGDAQYGSEKIASLLDEVKWAEDERIEWVKRGEHAEERCAELQDDIRLVKRKQVVVVQERDRLRGLILALPKLYGDIYADDWPGSIWLQQGNEHRTIASNIIKYLGPALAALLRERTNLEST